MTQPVQHQVCGQAGTLDSWFGPIAVQAERTITFRHGLFGFGNHTRFVLEEVPGREVPFKVLQSADDAEVGFLVVPIDAGGGPIAPADLEQACADLGYDRNSVIVLGIVTLRADPGAKRASVNLKAPVLIDTRRLLGCQYVLADEGYALQQPLPMA